MTIDPLEVMIAWLAGQLTDLSGRVAGKHRYGEAWTEGQTGISIHADGGAVDIYAAVATPRIEVRIYADDQVKVMDVWRSLVALSRTQNRFTVSTSKGTALVHYFLPQASLSLLFDDTLNMDMGVVFFESMISEEAVT